MALRIVHEEISKVNADVIVNAADADGKDARSFYQGGQRWAAQMHVRSIAFPLIESTTDKREQVLQIAIKAIDEFLSENEALVILAVPNLEAFVPAGVVFDGLDAYVHRRFRPEEEAGAAPQMSGALMANAIRVDKLPMMVPEAPEESELPVMAEASLAEDKPKASPEKKTKKRTKLLSEGKESGRRKAELELFDEVHEEASYCAMPLAKEDSLDDRVRHVADTWQESLLRWIDVKGYTDTEVYKRANVDRKLFSKIRSNRAYQPKKITAVAFALALELSLDDTKDFLGRAGYALSPSSVFDLIVEYFIEQEIYDTYTINLALFKHDQPILGE